MTCIKTPKAQKSDLAVFGFYYKASGDKYLSVPCMESPIKVVVPDKLKSHNFNSPFSFISTFSGFKSPYISPFLCI